MPPERGREKGRVSAEGIWSGKGMGIEKEVRGIEEVRDMREGMG